MNKFFQRVFSLITMLILCGCMPRPATLSIEKTITKKTSPNETPLQILKQGVIYYPYLAKDQGIEAKIYAKLLVNEKGLPENIEILRREFKSSYIQDSYGKWQDVTGIFDQVTIKSLEESVWIPATKEGIPKSSWVIVPFDYKARPYSGAVKIDEME